MNDVNSGRTTSRSSCQLERSEGGRQKRKGSTTSVANELGLLVMRGGTEMDLQMVSEEHSCLPEIVAGSSSKIRQLPLPLSIYLFDRRKRLELLLEGMCDAQARPHPMREDVDVFFENIDECFHRDDVFEFKLV